MLSVRSRLAKLEASAGGANRPGRVFAVCGGKVGEDPVDFIRAQGLQVDPGRDFIIHRILMAPSAKGPARVEYAWGWVGRPPAGASA